MVVAHDGTFHLGAADGFLHQNLAVKTERLCHGGFQFLPVTGTADADRRTEIDRLDKNRPAQLGLHPCGQFGGGGLLPAVNGKATGNGDACFGEQALGDILIHAVGAAGHPAAHIGQLRQFQKALHRAVLPVHAVQNGENHIDPAGLPAIGGLDHQAVVRRDRGKQAGGGQLRLFPAAIGDEGNITGIEQPFPRTGDADRQNFVFCTVQLPQDGADGEPGNIVLGGGAAEQHRNGQFFL